MIYGIEVSKHTQRASKRPHKNDRIVLFALNMKGETQSDGQAGEAENGETGI